MFSSSEHPHVDSTETAKKPSQPIDAKRRRESLAEIKNAESDTDNQEELAELGISLEDVFSHDKAKDKHIRAKTVEENTDSAEETASNALSIKGRFRELQKSDQPVSSILATLKEEFADSMDEETGAVIDKYSTLLSPEIFTDKEELEAVETLFYTQSHDFTSESFNSFVHTIYEEPDNVISEESKQKIEQAFDIPRTPIITGGDLAKATSLTDENGDFIYSSKDKALAFRKGVKTYMNADKNPVLLIEGSSRPRPMVVSSETFGDSEAIAKLSNYALIQQAVYDELGELTNLFGGGQEDEITTPDSSVVSRSNQFAALLIGKNEPNTILTEAQLGNLRSALKTLRDPSQIGENQSLSAMAELGILENGDFQWESVGKVGSILRENQFYTAFEMEQEGAGHDLLLAEIEQSLLHGKKKNTKMSITTSCGHFTIYTWNWWISRLFVNIHKKILLVVCF